METATKYNEQNHVLFARILLNDIVEKWEIENETESKGARNQETVLGNIVFIQHKNQLFIVR